VLDKLTYAGNPANLAEFEPMNPAAPATSRRLKRRLT
jgi:hypothetical protein